jgi:hypothetical protein
MQCFLMTLSEALFQLLSTLPVRDYLIKSFSSTLFVKGK